MRTRLETPYPMLRVLETPVGWKQEETVFIWDIDKTYLDTRFSQLKDLIRIPFEFGIDKNPLAGAVELLHALREGPDGRSHRPLHFVSASPPQISTSIERRMLLDGIEWDSISYKDSVRLLAKRQFRQVKEQIAYKLASMLLLAGESSPNARFHVFGDDVEHDALVASLFSDVLAGRLRGRALRSALLGLNCLAEYVEALVALADGLQTHSKVEGVWIRLERDRDGAWLEDFRPEVCGYRGVGSLASVLLERGLVSSRNASKLERREPDGLLKFGRRATRTLWTPGVAEPSVDRL